MKLAAFQVIICLGTAIANNIFSLYLHRLHCKNNTNMNSDNILTCELLNLTKINFIKPVQYAENNGRIRNNLVS